MNTPSKAVNAWIILQDDMKDQDYYKNLMENRVYESVDILNLCWVGIEKTSSTTTPTGDGSTYTPLTSFHAQLDGLVSDAKGINPNIKVLVSLGYNSSTWISRIFSGDESQWPAQAASFAANCVEYLKHYHLDGFDMDWESPVSGGPGPGQHYTKQVSHFLTALRSAFDTYASHNPGKFFHLTLSPATADHLDGTTVNDTVDFISMQLYSGFTSESDFTKIHIKKDILAYGAKFEAYHQLAQGAYAGMVSGDYSIATQWRLNSGNYAFEQAQQMILYQLVYGPSGSSFDDYPIVKTAGNPLISKMFIRSGDVLDAIQVVNSNTDAHYEMPQHGGNGGAITLARMDTGDTLTEITGYTGDWYGQNVVLQITLKTANGITYGPFGSMAGSSNPQPIHYKAQPGSSIIAFSGSTLEVALAGGGFTTVISELDVTYAKNNVSSEVVPADD